MRRVLLALTAVLGIGTGASFLTASPAAAGAVYPVCMFGPFNRMDCRYTSFPQCAATASGLGADCQVNPAYVARTSAYSDEPAPRRKRSHRHYYREYY
jgi:uncharacterized protein DUF3551